MKVALLVLAGVALLVPPADAAPANGRDLYLQGCARCHGLDGGGTVDGPPLQGVGGQAAHLYLSTGYMPLENPGDKPIRKDSAYSDGEIDALVDYVASLGGPPVAQPNPDRGSLGDGLRLFTENCAGCHQVAAEGGVVVG